MEKKVKSGTALNATQKCNTYERILYINIYIILLLLKQYVYIYIYIHTYIYIRFFSINHPVRM